MKRTTISETTHPEGYLIRKEKITITQFNSVQLSEAEDGVEGDIEDLQSSCGEEMLMVSAYTLDGCYIGSVEMAEKLFSRGIAPELHPRAIKDGLHCCSIGFCKNEQQWYGWSHRACCGFGIGSIVREGDCAYQAPTKEAFGRDRMNFFCSEGDFKINPQFKKHISADGEVGVLITATYSDEVPNEGLRGKRYETFCPYPEKLGRGEWIAETLCDAKKMAEDFAEGVS